MSHAEICPVCKGTGKVPDPNKYNSTALKDLVPCHGCNGLGWVTVWEYTTTPYMPTAEEPPHYVLTKITTDSTEKQPGSGMTPDEEIIEELGE